MNPNRMRTLLLLTQHWTGSIHLHHQIENPLDTPVCRNILETAKRMKLQPTNKKAPIKDRRIACICSLGFSGSFRYSELENISASRIHYEHDHVRISIYRLQKWRLQGRKLRIYKEIRQWVLPSGCFTTLHRGGDRAYSEPNLPIFRPLRFNFIGLQICSNYMEQDFHTQDTEKYSKNVYKNLDTMKRNMDYTVWDQVELQQQQPIMGTLQKDNYHLKLHGRWKTDIARTCICVKVLRTDYLLLRILDIV